MVAQLPLELETMITEFSASRSVEWFSSNMHQLLDNLSTYGRRNLEAIFKVSTIPMSQRVDFYQTTFALQIELDTIEKGHLEVFLKSLESASFEQ